MNIDSLTATPTFWYVATVYSKHQFGLGAAHAEACEILAKLWKAGVPAFSPIAHGHMVGEQSSLDQLSHDFWMKVDEPFMRAASGIIVVTMPGWMQSKGVITELNFFEDHGKQVVFLNPDTMEVTA